MNWNTTENCFQTIYHPSIPHGALVGASSLWAEKENFNG
jgi:hypothetical protein